MAKPMPTASTEGAGRSRRPPRRSQRQKDSGRRPGVRPSFSSPQLVAPSSGLLSFLATIASFPSSVDSSPTPPSFLCPYYASDPAVDTPCNPPLPSKPLSSLSTPINQRAGIRRHVPARYEKGDDGRWRRVDEYTLYGSTVCLVRMLVSSSAHILQSLLQTCTDPPTTVPSIDDQIQGGSNLPIDSPSPSPSPSSPSITPTFNVLDLPTGWKPPTTTTPSHTNLILALSLVLAFLICFFIIGCLFWRKSRRRKYRENDVEMKAKKRAQAAALDQARQDMVERESMIEKEVRVKQKIWARATARWKANARYSARQRKGKRIVHTMRNPQVQNPSTLPNNQEESSTSALSPSPSRSPSPLASSRSSYQSPSSPVSLALHIDEDEPPDRVPTLSVSSPSPPPVSPPAYHQRVCVPLITILGGDLLTDGQDSSSASLTPHRSRRPSHSSACHTPDESSCNDNLRIYTPSPHSAHVATDDKTLLARLATLASAPPPDTDSDPAEPSTIQVSAPAWRDEDYADIAESYDTSSSHESQPRSLTSLFPPPPSKGKLVSSEFYDYPYSFEEFTSLDPEPEPSAPPFEEGPNAPPIDDVNLLLPSAPPLLDIPEEFTEWVHEASQVETEPETMQGEMEGMVPENHDREEASYVVSRRTSSHGSLSLGNSVGLLHGPVASDGTPPCYHP